MRKFQFRLQKLLEIRSHKEKLVKNELAKAERKKYILVEKKENLLNELKGSRNKMREEEKEKILTVDRMRLYQQYFKRLRATTDQKDKLISLADDGIKLINDRLIEARKKKRVLERLKENKFKDYMYEFQKEEQNFFDEVGNTGFIKNKKYEEEENEKAKVKEKCEIPIKYTEYEKNLTERLYEEIMSKGELLK